MVNKVLLAIMSLFFVVVGCQTIPVVPGKNYGWNQVSPPRDNILGKEILSEGVFGDEVMKVTDSSIERSDSFSIFTNDQYSKYSATFDVFVKGVTANMGFQYLKSTKLSSRDWKIIQIKKFAYTLPVEKRFVYQCLTASNYTYEIFNKKGFDAKLDVTAIAKKFGVDKAEIKIDSKPDNPNILSVTVTNPNVCLSYKSAYFKDDNWRITGSLKNKYVHITGRKGNEKYSTTFELKPGQKSEFRSPQFSGPEPPHKPWYRLMATLDDNNNKVNLAICKQDRGTGERDYTCKDLIDDGYGNWDRPYHIDTFGYGNNKYKIVNLNIKAKRTNHGSILVSWAKLTYPQYILVID